MAKKKKTETDESTESASSDEIVVTNIGPIEEFRLKLPDVGGVVVITGDNGVGKSNLIDAINALVTKRGKLFPRDLADIGTVEGLGGKVRAAGTTTRSGDIETPSLDDRFDFADLIDPQVTDEEARESVRIKALIGLSGVKSNIESFYTLVGGKEAMDRLLVTKEQAITDPVKLAAKIKEAIERSARDVEQSHQKTLESLREAKSAATGVDLEQPHDDAVLQAELVKAAGVLSKLEEQVAAYATAKRQADEATAKLTEHRAKQTLTVEQAREAVDVATKAFEDAEAVVSELEEKIRELEHAKTVALGVLSTKDVGVKSAKDTLAAVEQASAAVGGWQATIDQVETLPHPSDEEVAAAKASQSKAVAAVETGALVRRAKAKLEEAAKFEKEASELSKQAGKLRDQAGDVYKVLSRQIPDGPLYVVAGTLVIDTPDRKAEKYDRLSTGERWRVALPYAVDAVGEGGIICAPQEAWQDLGDKAKGEVAEYCKSRGVVLITGQVTNGPLSSEIYEPTAPATPSNAELAS